MVTKSNLGTEVRPPRTVKEFIKQRSDLIKRGVKEAHVLVEALKIFSPKSAHRCVKEWKVRMRNNGLMSILLTLFIMLGGCGNYKGGDYNSWKDLNSVGDIGRLLGGNDQPPPKPLIPVIPDLAASYQQPNGAFDGLFGWTNSGNAKGTFTRAYAASQLVAPLGVSGNWFEEITNTSVTPPVTATSPLNGTALITGVSCLTATSALGNEEDISRVVFKDDKGDILAEGDFFRSKHFDLAQKKIAFVASKTDNTISMGGTKRPYQWFGRNGDTVLRTDAIDGQLNQTVTYVPLSRFPFFTSSDSLKGLHRRGPATGSLTTNLVPVDLTARTSKEIIENPTLKGIIDGRILRDLMVLTPADYNFTVVRLPEIGSSRLDTNGSDFESADPDNASLKVFAFTATTGHVRSKGTTFTKLALRPSTSILTLTKDEAGREITVLGTTSDGNLVDVTMDIPLVNFQGFDPNLIELRFVGSNPTQHPDVKDKLIAIPKGIVGGTTINLVPPATLGANLGVETMTVKVQPALLEIVVTPQVVTIEEGATVKYEVTKVFSNNTTAKILDDVVPTIDNPLGGTLDKATGVLTGGKLLGEYHITWVTKETKPVTTTFTLDKSVQDIVVEPSNFSALVNDAVDLKTTLFYTDGTKADGSARVVLESSDPSIINPISSSKVKIQKEGSATITAKVIAKGGDKKSNVVNGVGGSAANVTRIEGPSEVLEGTTVQYNAVDAAGKVVTSTFPIAVSDSSFLSVNSSGQGIAKKVGQVTLTAQGTKATLVVTVLPDTSKIQSVSISPSSITGKVSDKGNLTVGVTFTTGQTGKDPLLGIFTVVNEKDENSNATTGVVTVSASGAFELKKLGSATIRFTVGSKTVDATVTVTVPQLPITDLLVATTIVTMTNKDAPIKVKITEKRNNATGPAQNVQVKSLTPANAAVDITIVSDEAVFTPKANRSGSGTVILTKDGKDAPPIQYTINGVIAKILKPADQTVTLGASGQVPALKAELNDTANAAGPTTVDLPFGSVTMTPADATVSTVSALGVINSLKVGATTVAITLVADPTIIQTMAITVNAAPTITGLTASPSSVALDSVTSEVIITIAFTMSNATIQPVTSAVTMAITPVTNAPVTVTAVSGTQDKFKIARLPNAVFKGDVTFTAGGFSARVDYDLRGGDVLTATSGVLSLAYVKDNGNSTSDYLGTVNVPVPKTKLQAMITRPDTDPLQKVTLVALTQNPNDPTKYTFPITVVNTGEQLEMNIFDGNDPATATFWMPIVLSTLHAFKDLDSNGIRGNTEPDALSPVINPSARTVTKGTKR